MMKILVPRGHREKGKMGEDKMKKWKITDEDLATFKEITTNDSPKVVNKRWLITINLKHI